jgi:GntR family transcriptional regulator
MNLLVSQLSQTPIYEQIRAQIKELVLTGSLSSGEQLPSIRMMAKDLKVGIITVTRAYEELEKEGIIVNLQGRGCFVNEIDKAAVKRMHLQMLREQLQEIKKFCDTSGIKCGELLEEVEKLYGGNDDGTSAGD